MRSQSKIIVTIVEGGRTRERESERVTERKGRQRTEYTHTLTVAVAHEITTSTSTATANDDVAIIRVRVLLCAAVAEHTVVRRWILWHAARWNEKGASDWGTKSKTRVKGVSRCFSSRCWWCLIVRLVARFSFSFQYFSSCFVGLIVLYCVNAFMAT